MGQMIHLRVFTSSIVISVLSFAGATLLRTNYHVFFQKVAGGVFGFLGVIMLLRAYFTSLMEPGMLSQNAMMGLVILIASFVIYLLPLIYVFH